MTNPELEKLKMNSVEEEIVDIKVITKATIGKQQLTIYLKNGNTLRFEKVKNFDFDVEYMSFDYVSKSQKTNHTAWFRIDAIAGHSLLDEEVK